MIGLPLFQSAPACGSDFLDGSSLGSTYSVRVGGSLILKMFTSEDISLETGGSVWHAGKTSLRVLNNEMQP